MTSESLTARQTTASRSFISLLYPAVYAMTVLRDSFPLSQLAAAGVAHLIRNQGTMRLLAESNNG